MSYPLRFARRATTLIELAVVLVVLVALASLVLPMLTSTGDQARVTATEETMRRVREVIMNRYVIDMRGAVVGSSSPFVVQGFPGPAPVQVTGGRDPRPQMAYLFVNPVNGTTVPQYNPVSKLGWNGPYLLTSQSGTYPRNDQYGLQGDPTPLDAWGNPIIMVSAIDVNSVPVLVLVSAGANGTIETSEGFTFNPTVNTSDDYRLPLR